MSYLHSLPIRIGFRVVPVEPRNQVLDRRPQTLRVEREEDQSFRIIEVEVRSLHCEDHRLTGAREAPDAGRATDIYQGDVALLLVEVGNLPLQRVHCDSERLSL